MDDLLRTASTLPRTTPALELTREAIEAPSLDGAAAVRYVTAGQLAPELHENVFGALARSVARESTLLHPKTEDLITSYRNGESVIALDGAHEDLPIGHVRLEPLISAALRAALSLPATFPVLYEAGTMFVSREGRYRGQGHLRPMCSALLQHHSAALNAGEMLVIGTTKDIRVLRALDDGGVLNFSPVHHLTFPLLAAFTCICAVEAISTMLMF